MYVHVYDMCIYICTWVRVYIYTHTSILILMRRQTNVDEDTNKDNIYTQIEELTRSCLAGIWLPTCLPVD